MTHGNRGAGSYHLMPQTRRFDLNDDSLTENTRCAYPLDYIDNHWPPKMAGHPRNVILLTCDASGVMPPIARLTPDQAISTDAHQWRDIQRLWRTLQRAAAGFSLRRASTAS